MALVQTDQGWFADENWMKQNYGTLGTSGSRGLVPPYLSNLSYNNILANGLYVGISRYNGVDYPVYIASIAAPATKPAVVVWIGDSSSYRNLYIIGDSTYYPYNRTWGAVVTSHDSARLEVESASSLVRVTVDGHLYYCQYGYSFYPGASYDVYAVNPDIPVFSTVEDAVRATITTYSKANTGYALALWAKYTEYGTADVVCRAILISHFQGPAHIQKNGTGGSEVENVYSYGSDNRILYMAMSIDTVSENALRDSTVIIADFTGVAMPSNTASVIANTLYPLIIQQSDFHWGEIDNPYSDMGTTTTGGGIDGTHEITSNPVSVPITPSFAITNAGFFSVWLPDELQIQKIAAWMWNGKVTTIDFWKRMVTSPTDLILGLSMVPFVISPDGQAKVSLGYISTGLTVDYTNRQFFELDFGTIDIKEVWAAYLDYNPYTTIEVFLPYIGSRRLDTDEVMNKRIHLVYKVDIISGACVAIISVPDYTNPSLETVLYQFMGNCSTQIPVTAEEMINIVRNTVNLITSAASFVNTGGSVGEHESGASGKVASHKAAGAGMVSSALNLATTKQSASRTGSISSAAGFIGVQRPYLIIKRPRQAFPEDQNIYTGYPSFITERIGELEGYTEIEVIHLDNIPCTADELDEIDTLLKNGVIL